MPWKESTAVEQREALIDDWLKGRHSLTALAEAYGVSRKTAHKWVKRLNEGGKEALRFFTEPKNVCVKL